MTTRQRLVLGWIRSYLAERTQRVVYQDDISLLVWLLCGVPQGFVLGPLLFLLYTAELFGVIGAHEATSHFYADDGQLYVNCPAADAEVTICQLGACVAADVDAWMKAIRLRLNPQKTQLIWLGSPQQLERLTMVDIELMSASLSPLSAVRDLGVTIDSPRTMADHVSAVCRACYFQLRQLRVVLQSLTSEAVTRLRLHQLPP